MDTGLRTRVPLEGFVNAARIGQLQEAMRVVHSSGRTGLAESLREWTEQLIEALALAGCDDAAQTLDPTPRQE